MKLRYILFAIVLFAGGLLACSDERSQALQKENEALKEKAKNDSLYIASINDEMDLVYNNLDSVKALADSIMRTSNLLRNQRIGTREGGAFINQGMADIDSLLESNRVRIAQLEDKLKKSNRQNLLLGKMLARLRKELSEKEEVIAKLNQQVAQLDKEVKGLQIEKRQVTEQLSKKVVEAEEKASLAQEDAKIKTELLNTAYYLIGRKKELEVKGIVKTKGLLKKVDGLGDVLDEKNFYSVDILKDKQIELGSDKIKDKNVEIVPARAADQYLLSREGGKLYLNITNPQAFWKKSKYLVVVVD